MLFNAKLVLLHPVVLYALMCAVLLGFSLLVLILARWLVHRRLLGKHNDLAGYLFTAVGVIYGVLLAFVAIMVWGQYNDAISNSVVEASQALTLYRDLNLYPDPKQTAVVKQALVAYLNSVIHEEYPALAQGRFSRPTEQAINRLWLAVHSFHPRDAYQEAVFRNILRDLDKLAALRTSRLAAAQINLPNIVWSVLIIGAGLTLVFASLFGTEKFWAHLLLVVLLAVLMASTLFLILEMDDPFMGGLSPQPTVFQEVLQSMNVR